MNIKTKYTFSDPTKSGGTACENYFEKYYSKFITGKGHYNRCNNCINPIIIVRDVYSRFFSMFKYWKYGSIDTKYKRSEKFIESNKDVTILDFITMLKNNQTQKLYDDFTWKLHFVNTTFWINNTNYKNIIVIKYVDDLNDKIHKLLNILEIPNKNIKLEHINISKNNNNDNIFYEKNKKEIDDFINLYFKEDIKLMNTIEKNPEKFKYVI